MTINSGLTFILISCLTLSTHGSTSTDKREASNICLTRPLTVAGKTVSLCPSRVELEALLRTKLKQTAVLHGRHGEIRSVDTCIDWYKLEEQGYENLEITRGFSSLEQTCPPLWFLMISARQPWRRSTAASVELTPAMLPANMLPTFHTFVEEYTSYARDGITYESLRREGRLTLTRDGATILIRCLTSPNFECGGLGQRITEVARGHFLREGLLQVLVRAETVNLDGGPGLGHTVDSAGQSVGSVFYLLSFSSTGAHPMAYEFSPLCKTEEYRALMNLEPVPCPNHWPANVSQ